MIGLCTAIAAGLAAAAAPLDGALAARCSDSEISAKGEPATFKWLALVKARGNWRSKVRGLPGLGAGYANYGQAADPVERCISDARNVVCTVSARPCTP